MCHHTAVIVAPAVVGGLLLKGLLIGGVFAALRHHEKKERRALADLQSKGQIEEKTVIIENRGPQQGAGGVAEVVTSGPAGTAVSTVSTVTGGAVVVSTAEAGIKDHTVTVEPGKTAVVKAEHPVGKPEETTVVSTTQQ